MVGLGFPACTLACIVHGGQMPQATLPGPAVQKDQDGASNANRQAASAGGKGMSTTQSSMSLSADIRHEQQYQHVDIQLSWHKMGKTGCTCDMLPW